MFKQIFIFATACFALAQCQADKFQVIKRDLWTTRPPTRPMNHLKLPVPTVIIAHTASSECASVESCVTKLLQIQDFHMDTNKFSDIGYNFLIGGDGLVYEGRGWGLEGAHTKGHNKQTICIAFIGNFGSKTPTKLQLQAAQLLLEQGVTTKSLSLNYKLYGQRQLKPTESPGDRLYAIISSWPHWSAV